MQITLRNFRVSNKIQELTLERNKIEDKALLECREPNEEEKANIDEINKKISYMEIHANRTYTAPFIEFESYKDFFEIQNKPKENEAESLALITSFICKIFGNQFTEEEFLRGIALSKLNYTVLGIYDDINKMIHEGVEEDTQY